MLQVTETAMDANRTVTATTADGIDCATVHGRSTVFTGACWPSWYRDSRKGYPSHGGMSTRNGKRDG
jgi:hypothetical protein